MSGINGGIAVIVLMAGVIAALSGKTQANISSALKTWHVAVAANNGSNGWRGGSKWRRRRRKQHHHYQARALA